MASHCFAQTLLAHYPFMGNANDNAGTLNGTVSGASLSTDRFNLASNAFSFNGTNNSINLGNSTLIRPTNGLTVSLWFELNSTGVLSGRSMVSCTENSGYAIHYLANNTIECVVHRNGAYGSVSVSATPYDNTGWHFAAMTYDGRYLKLYLDGNLMGTNDAGAMYPISYVTDNTYIGADPSGASSIDPNFYYKGKLDEIKFYNEALTSNEIAAEFANNIPIPPVGLKMWLRSDTGLILNGNHVAQWNDLSGNNNNAVQTAGSNQPELIDQVFNNKAALHFDGINDILYTPQIDLSSTPKVTVFVVNKANDEGVILEASHDVNTNTNGFYLFDNFASTGISAALKGDAAGPFNDYLSMFKSTSTFYTPKICHVVYDKTQASYLNQVKVRVNGNDIVNTNGYGGAHTNNFGNDTIFIGGRGSGGNNLNGDIAEVIVYNRLLSGAERSQVENYLNLRYNVSTSLAQSKPGSGNAMTYDGVNDYTSVPSPVYNAYTIETWVKFTGTTANKNVIVLTNASGPGSTWSHQIRTSNTGKFQHYNYDGSGNNVVGTTTINQNQWYHVCITAQNNSTARLFVNGVEEGTPISVGTLWTLGTEFRIASSTGGGAGILNGQVDEFRVWNTVLTPDQIRARICRKITPEDPLYPHLVLNLNFDENAGNTAFDVSSNNRNGTHVNGPGNILSGASIGNSSTYQYAGAASSANLTKAPLGDFTATLSGGTAAGIHVYQVNENPWSRIGIDSMTSNEGYFGVFVANGNAANYTAKYHYTGYGGVANEYYLNLYKRDHNADNSWENASATLNVDSNTLIVSGQNTEYYLGGNPVLVAYFHDQDGDGYGNPLDSLLDYSTPSGYVNNKTDCNDNDSLQHPGQIWYIDQDHDGYGTGASIVQCNRPFNGYVASELNANAGDCNDTVSAIYPNYQLFEYTGNGAFANAVISTDNGDSYTIFNFEVIYKNANGELPATTFPRVILDYEGNGIYNNSNDRTIFMMEDDINDQNTMDGKKYIASINSLPTGTNWKTFIQTNVTPCGSNFGPFNYPDVLVRPDLEIFANDITFDNPHPAVLSPLLISAEIHNVSDYAAQNFVVHLLDQYNPSLSFGDIVVQNLAPHSSTTVTWNLTTIAIPSWHPIQVIVDYTNVINESNELDNVALRPYINGNYNLPGSIQTTAFASPAISYSGSNTTVTLSGTSYYSGTAVPLIDSSVAGATVTFTIVETGATFSTYTNSQGHFAHSFPKPLPAGIYHVTGTCTDYTLTGNLSAQFEVITPVIQTCQLPDLISAITVDSTVIIVGHSLNGTMIVKNVGHSTSTPTTFSFSQSGGTPQLATSYAIPSLAVNATYSIPFTLTFNTTGQFSLCGLSDATYIQNECYENNSSCKIINVLPDLPDIVPTNGPVGTYYQCPLSTEGFVLRNYGGVSTGPFNCRVNVRLNGSLINTYNQTVSNILPVQYTPSNVKLITIPFVPVSLGNYTFEVLADYPVNEVLELNELNNNATYSITVIACKPDFSFSGCENFTVESNNHHFIAGSNITLKAKLGNGGNLAYNGLLKVRYALSNGATYYDTMFVSLNPGSSVFISKDIPAPSPSTTILTITADPFSEISELNESNNDISSQMCWDFQPVALCGFNFWEHSYLVNQAVYLSVGVTNHYLYQADTLKVKFEVSGPGLSGTLNLGNATLYNVSKTCYCPYQASLPTNFAFPQTGTYTFTMTVDPDHEFPECNEVNNVLIRTVNVTNLPDMRILSQHIAPSKLNPDPNESISMNITYENIGSDNINDQMKLKVIMDNTPLDSIYPLNGLVHNGNATIAIPASWSSPLVGIHVIRAIIDADDQITETDELNNEATRAIVVGESANLYFQAFHSTTLTPYIDSMMTLNTRIGNNGDLDCEADVQYFYVDDLLDTIQFASQHISVNAHDSIQLNQTWTVADNSTTLIARIVNSTILEYTYDDNEARFGIGDLRVDLFSEPYCNYGQPTGSIGYLNASVFGGTPPYQYQWNTGSTSSVMSGPVGTYSLSLLDSKGQSLNAIGTIDTCTPVFIQLALILQGYYAGNHLMYPVLNRQGIFTWSNAVDSVTVELRKDSISFPLLGSYQGLLRRDGVLKAYFNSPELIGSSCYIAIKHRNSIETWSANPIMITSSCQYDFSHDATSAYGNNEALLSGTFPIRYAIYSGDINQEGNIDLIDNIQVENSSNQFEIGYQTTDLNGDGNVDLLDIPVLEENISNFIFSMHP